MSRYMLNLYDDPTAFANLAPAQIQAVIEEYMAWGERLRAEGRWQAGEKLSDEPGKVIRSGEKPQVTDGPYSETREILGGFYMIQAKDYDDAVKVALTSPHVRYGGTIEVRAIEDMG